MRQIDRIIKIGKRLPTHFQRRVVQAPSTSESRRPLGPLSRPVSTDSKEAQAFFVHDGRTTSAPNSDPALAVNSSSRSATRRPAPVLSSPTRRFRPMSPSLDRDRFTAPARELIDRTFLSHRPGEKLRTWHLTSSPFTTPRMRGGRSPKGRMPRSVNGCDIWDSLYQHQIRIDNVPMTCRNPEAERRDLRSGRLAGSTTPTSLSVL